MKGTTSVILLVALAVLGLVTPASAGPTNGVITFKTGKTLEFHHITGLRQNSSSVSFTAIGAGQNAFGSGSVTTYEATPGELVFALTEESVGGELRIALQRVTRIEFVTVETFSKTTVKVTDLDGKVRTYSVRMAWNAVDVVLADGLATHRLSMLELEGATIRMPR